MINWVPMTKRSDDGFGDTTEYFAEYEGILYYYDRVVTKGYVWIMEDWVEGMDYQDAQNFKIIGQLDDKDKLPIFLMSQVL